MSQGIESLALMVNVGLDDEGGSHAAIIFVECGRADLLWLIRVLRLDPKLVHHVRIRAHVVVQLVAAVTVVIGFPNRIPVRQVVFGVLAHLDLDQVAALPRADIVVPAQLIQVVLLLVRGRPGGRVVFREEAPVTVVAIEADVIVRSAALVRGALGVGQAFSAFNGTERSDLGIKTVFKIRIVFVMALLVVISACAHVKSSVIHTINAILRCLFDGGVDVGGGEELGGVRGGH